MNLSTRERQLITTLVVLLIVLATFQILADLTEVLSRVADVLIIFVAAWAVSYLLSPLVTQIDQRTVLNRALSVVVVYIGIAFVLAALLALAVPGLVAQLNDLVTRAPSSTAFATATTIPRSLNDPVGFWPSTLSQTSGMPSSRSSVVARTSGVFPSPSESRGVRSVTGRYAA